MATILIVEDNASNQKLFALMLRHTGHRVLMADNAEEGLRQAREECPALVLMDVQLPGTDGLTATRLLKADPATAHIKVIALTAMAMKGDEEKVRAAGCDGYIPKPVRHAQFVAQVEAALAG